MSAPLCNKTKGPRSALCAGRVRRDRNDSSLFMVSLQWPGRTGGEESLAKAIFPPSRGPS